ncbi:MAG: hypothetical protein WC130_03635 [Kiritimatiellia bacterium]
MALDEIQTSIHGSRLGLDAYDNLIVGGRRVGPGVVTRSTPIYVDSVNGSATGNGKSPGTAVSTLALAFDLVTAAQGDLIVVLPGHTETLTASYALDVAGVYVLGLGKGDDMPQFLMNHANAEISIAANGITLDGLRFSADVTSVAIGIEIEDGIDYTTIKNCVFDVVTAGTDEFTAAIHMVNDNTGTVIENNVIDQGIAAAVAAIHMDADTANTVIRGNKIYGDYSTGCIIGDTTLSTNVLIEKNLLVNGVGGNINSEPGIELLTGTTGIIRDNDIVSNLATMAASIVADTCLCFRNYYNEDVGGGATGGAIGTASADD